MSLSRIAQVTDCTFPFVFATESEHACCRLADDSRAPGHDNMGPGGEQTARGRRKSTGSSSLLARIEKRNPYSRCGAKRGLRRAGLACGREVGTRDSAVGANGAGVGTNGTRVGTDRPAECTHGAAVGTHGAAEGTYGAAVGAHGAAEWARRTVFLVSSSCVKYCCRNDLRVRGQNVAKNAGQSVRPAAQCTPNAPQ
jgi:hypothetical protein